jgi:leader peptidase (prepilin peptidase) / N-methyltransferase
LSNEPFATFGPRHFRLSEAGRRMKRALLRAARVCAVEAPWGAAALCAAIASVLAAPGWRGILGAALSVDMLAIAAVDSRSWVIPDKLVLAGLALGLVDASLADPSQIAGNLANAAFRAFVLVLLFFLFRMAYHAIRSREGLGLGDVKLAGVAGAWLQWTAAGLAIDIATLSALAVVLVGALRGGRMSATTRVPFGLFFAPAIWLAWLLGALIPYGVL